MSLKIAPEIFLICEQEGEIERMIKQKFSQLFANYAKPIRAYLVRIRYVHSHSPSVALCIRTTDEDIRLVEQCAQQFSSIFAANQHLDILFISEQQEQIIRKQCCPFYTSTNYLPDVPDFYLFSNEGYHLDDQIRACFKLKRLYGSNPHGYLLCAMDPPLIGQIFGLGGQDIHQVILAIRFEGDSLFPVSNWPCYVHVARSLINLDGTIDQIEKTDMELIAWAALYDSRDSVVLSK